jgi:hypothetical protein
MIKIEHPDLDKIAKAYFVDVKERIKERSDFLLQVLNVLFNGIPYNILETHSLHGGTKKSLTNQLLSTANRLTDQTQYSTLTAANLNPWVAGASGALRDICTYLNDDINLEELILCIPDKAIQTENAFKVNIGLPVVLNVTVKNFVNSIIDYSLFDNYAYDTAKSLNVNTCPYCNRNYINTVLDKNGEHIIRPTFDHFFPQKLHPFLALSFYNLIPSCYFCNSSLKSSDPISIDTHIHPYKEGFDKDANFHVLISNLKPNKSDPENYSLFIADNMMPLSPTDRYRKIFGGVRGAKNLKEGNVNLFKLEEIYQSHLDIVGELRVKADKLNSWYGKSIVKMFPLLNTNVEEFYQYYFGNYLNEKNFHRRPMAKLSKDVVSQIIPFFVK